MSIRKLKPYCLILNVAGALIGALAHDGVCIMLNGALATLNWFDIGWGPKEDKDLEP